MKNISVLGRIRTHKHIRTRHSIRTSTSPGRALWPRLKETEQLRLEENRLWQGRPFHKCVMTKTKLPSFVTHQLWR